MLFHLWKTSIAALLFGLQHLVMATMQQFDNTLMCPSSMVTTHIYSAVIHYDMSMHASITVMLMPSLPISLHLLTLWFCLDSQYAMNNCGPGLYRIHMLYQWMHNSIPCCWGDRLAMSFLKIITGGLWSIITLTSKAKQYWWNFFECYWL